jgi:hypothetical protein
LGAAGARLMSISAEIVDSYKNARPVIARKLAQGPREDQALALVMGAGLNITGATGYMFSNIVGIRGVLGFDSFKTAVDGDEAGVEDKSYMLRATLEGVLSISQIANFGTDKFDLNFHAGFGFASHVNPSWKEDRLAVDGFEFEDPALKGNDDMINVVFGLTPKYHINENISITADFSYVMLMKKDWTNDRSNNTAVEGLDGFCLKRKSFICAAS